MMVMAIMMTVAMTMSMVLSAQYWGQLRYELRHLTFASNYTVQVYNTDEHFLMYSEPANVTFRTLESCLEATDYDYNLCRTSQSSPSWSVAPLSRWCLYGWTGVDGCCCCLAVVFVLSVIAQL